MFIASNELLEIPKIKLYTVYTGDSVLEDHYIYLNELMCKDEIESDIDLKVKVICEENKGNLLGQYISFCRVFKEQCKLVSDRKEAIENTIKICIDENVLREFLSKRKHEVNEMLAHPITSEEYWKYIGEQRFKEGEVEGRKEGKIEGIKTGLITSARNMLKNGIDKLTIAKCTGLSMEEINNL